MVRRTPTIGLALAILATATPASQARAATAGGELSPWSMFMGADIVVKAIMVGLALASVLTWTIVLAKSVEIRRSRRRLAADLPALLAQRSLAAEAQARGGGAAVRHHADGTA